MNAPAMGVRFLYRGGADIARDRPRILFIATPSWLPALSTSGSPMIAHALTKAFATRGWGVGFLGLVKPDRWPGSEKANERIRAADADRQSCLWYSPRTLTHSDDLAVAAVIGEMDPEIVYCFGPEAAMLARRAHPRGRIVTTFYEPPYLPALYKRLIALKFAPLRTRLNALCDLPGMLKRWLHERKSDLPGLAAADVVIAHSYNHSVKYSRKLNRRVEYFPNPLEQVAPVDRKTAHRPPAFLLAGNVASTVSLSGFYFLRDQVLPHLAHELSRGDLQIMIIGGGKLPEALSSALAMYPNVNILGHVDEARLRDVYSRAIALLVPTPIPVGFRTRIVDAFRHGVPAIVHAANRAGFRQLEHGQNCLMTSNGAQFAQLMRDALADPGRMQTIAQTARKEFEQYYSADVFYRFIVETCRCREIRAS